MGVTDLHPFLQGTRCPASLTKHLDPVKGGRSQFCWRRGGLLDPGLGNRLDLLFLGVEKLAHELHDTTSREQRKKDHSDDDQAHGIPVSRQGSPTAPRLHN